MVEKMIQQSDIIRRAYDKSIKKSTNDILIKQKNTIDDIDKKIKFLEEQNNKLKELIKINSKIDLVQTKEKFLVKHKWAYELNIENKNDLLAKQKFYLRCLSYLRAIFL